MLQDFPLRVKAAVAAAAVLSLWGVLVFFEYEKTYRTQFGDPYRVAQQAQRLEGVRAAVPEDAVMGYFTDTEPGSVTAMAMFNSAQYVLAPRILREGSEAAWVLGNFTRQVDYRDTAARANLRLMRDFGSGVVLFRKEGR